MPLLRYVGWRGHGWAELGLRAGAALAVFAGCNLPFILLGSGDWLAGVTGPLHDPMFALGVGLVVLSIAKVLPLWAAATYLKLELAAYALAFGFYTRCWRKMPALALLLPLIPMALAWRSLHTYFMFLPMLATAALADQSRRAPAASTADPTPGAAEAPTQSRVACGCISLTAQRAPLRA